MVRKTKKKSTKKTAKKTVRKKKTAVKKRATDLTSYLISRVRKDFGREAIMTMKGEKRHRVEVVCSTGYPDLDDALGIGGIPRGRIIEVYGPESSGKTTLTLHMIAEAQKAGCTAGFIDAEHALDPDYARKLEVNVDDLLLSQPDCGEQVFDIIASMIKGQKEFEAETKRDTKTLFIVVDSVAAMTPRAEIKGLLDDDAKGAGLGAQARMMSEGLRKLVSVVANNNVVVVFINQIRVKIGNAYGNPEYTTGGNALKFYTSIRMEIRASGKYEEGGELVGRDFKIKIVKNKCAPPFRKCSGLLRFGVGMDKVWPIFNLLKDEGLITRSKKDKKAWLEVEGHPEFKKFAGFKGFRKTYEEHKQEIDAIYHELRNGEDG